MNYYLAVLKNYAVFEGALAEQNIGILFCLILLPVLCLVLLAQ